MRTWIGVVAVAMLACGAKRDEPSKKDLPATGSAPAPAAPTTPAPPAPDAAATVQRPSWITTAEPGASFCEDLAGKLVCQGVSPFKDDKNAAKQAAIGEALDAMALRVAREATAQKAGRPWTPNDETPIPPKALAAARKELDASLGIGPSTAPVTDEWYWEEYAKQQGSGTEFLGFARMVLPAILHEALAMKLTTRK